MTSAAKCEKCFTDFPGDAVVSQYHVFSDGATVEAAMFGGESMIGLSTVFDSIGYRRGRVRIAEKQALEAAACECYRALSLS